MLYKNKIRTFSTTESSTKSQDSWMKRIFMQDGKIQGQKSSLANQLKVVFWSWVKEETNDSRCFLAQGRPALKPTQGFKGVPCSTASPSQGNPEQTSLLKQVRFPEQISSGKTSPSSIEKKYWTALHKAIKKKYISQQKRLYLLLTLNNLCLRNLNFSAQYNSKSWKDGVSTNRFHKKLELLVSDRIYT